MPHLRSRTAGPLAVMLAVALLTGCAADGWGVRRPHPTPLGSPGAGFLPASEPQPESTLSPPTGSWEGVRPPEGYRVVLLTAGTDAPTRTIADAVREWAEQERVDLRTVEAQGDLIDGIVEAIELAPDLVVSAGDSLIDPLAVVTPHHLDQQFLIVGAELAEPTINVTAADWTGAAFRGEGLGASSHYDARSFTPERCAMAVRAGVAAVLTGLTGVVLWIE